MKFLIKSILFILIIITPLSVHAGRNTLIDKVNYAWFDNTITVMFDFDNNKYILIIGTKNYMIPISNIKQIANVAFFKDAKGFENSITYISPEMIKFHLGVIKKTFTLIRWNFTLPLLDKIEGAWYNSDGTVIFNFKNKKKTIIIGNEVTTHDLKDISEIVNTIIYYSNGIKHIVRYVNDDMITWCKGADEERYVTFFRWHENQ